MEHSNDFITTGRDGKRFQPERSLEVVAQLDYNS